jgi:thioesterase domain-containing protein
MKVAARREQRARSAQQDARAHDAATFRSRLIEAAFYRALSRYQIERLPVDILLCRPRLQPTHVFGPGRAINRDRRRIYHDNGWTRFARHVEVFETPGDHDNMVLEPNVRILAAHLRPALEEAERAAQRRAIEPPAARVQARSAPALRGGASSSQRFAS